MRLRISAPLARVRLHRIVLSLLAVPAVLVGLLAMHVITLPGVTEVGHGMTSVTAVEHAAPDVGASIAPIACQGDCDGHAMTAMACILALLILTVVLAAAASTSGALRDLLSRLTGLLPRGPSHVAPRRPPSLSFLSISRI